MSARNPTYPGVYILELPSAVRTITGVSTSITAFIGRAIKGPTDRAMTIHSFAEYERIFGGLWKRSNMSYAVYHYFQNGGKDAVIVRVHNNAVASTFRMLAPFIWENITTAFSFIWEEVPNNNTETEKLRQFLIQHFNLNWVEGVVPTKSEDDRTITFSHDGNTLNIALNDAPAAATEATFTIADTDHTFTAESRDGRLHLFMIPSQTFSFIWEEVPTNETETDKLRQFLMQNFNLDWVEEADVTKSVDGNTINLSDDGSTLDIALNAARTEATFTIADTDHTFTAESRDGRLHLFMDIDFGLRFRASNVGLWGNDLLITINRDVDAEKLEEDNALFNLIVTDTKTGASETFLNLSTYAESSRFITRVLTEESNLIRVNNAVIIGQPPESTSVVLDSGSDGDTLTDQQITGNANNKTGMYALDNTDLFNLLCIPPYTSDETTPGAVYSDAVTYCEQKRAMLIVDSPRNWNNRDTARDGIDNPAFGLSRHKNAAIFFPRIKAPDPLEENRLREFVPSGAVAGVISRTDSERGLWKSPAGIEATLIGVPDLTVRLTDEENGDLNPLGINCIRIFPVIGRIVWGARTMRGADRLADQWKYLAVRRMALYIEESLYRGTQWVVFEPNDEKLWGVIRMNVGAFMHDLFTKGAFQGTDPKKAYFVKCDSETTTQYDIDRGIVNIVVGFAPLKPAEFVILKIQQIAGKERE